MDEKQKLLKEIGIIQSMPTPKRWRAAADFTLKVNPLVAHEYNLHCQEVQKMRTEQKNKFASAEKSGLRFGFSMPTSMLTAIRAFDSDFLMEDKRKGATTYESNSSVRQVMELFPELKVPKVI